MTNTKFGIIVGAVLALSGAAFGFGAFLFVAIAMAIGAATGRVLDGKLDLSSVVDVFRGKRTSS